MPIPTDTGSAGAFQSGGTLFERMRRTSQADVPERPAADIPSYIRHASNAGQNLVVVDIAPHSPTGIRFGRAEVEGRPGVVMQERDDHGQWVDIWSLPTQSLDAREGMIGWLNTQGHRWDRFALMLHRRGPEELTAWIFELMVVPNTAEATAPRFEPRQGWRTIDRYDRNVRDDCACRPPGLQHSRHF